MHPLVLPGVILVGRLLDLAMGDVDLGVERCVISVGRAGRIGIGTGPGFGMLKPGGRPPPGPPLGLGSVRSPGSYAPAPGPMAHVDRSRTAVTHGANIARRLTDGPSSKIWPATVRPPGLGLVPCDPMAALISPRLASQLRYPSVGTAHVHPATRADELRPLLDHPQIAAGVVAARGVHRRRPGIGRGNVVLGGGAQDAAVAANTTASMRRLNGM